MKAFVVFSESEAEEAREALHYHGVDFEEHDPFIGIECDEDEESELSWRATIGNAFFFVLALIGTMHVTTLIIQHFLK